MKSYLSLIPISAKVRKRQNRMTVLCIIISVFLVTAIFSVADMMIRTESDFMISNHGNWHIAIKNISQNNANEISNRSDVTAVGVASQFNFEGEQPYRVNEKRTVFYGTDEVYITQISNGIVEGTFPANDEEVMLTPNSVTALGVQLGDSVTLHTPAGDLLYAGVDPKTVQYLAGRENSKTTMDIYAKVKYNKPEELFGVVNQAFIHDK